MKRFISTTLTAVLLGSVGSNSYAQVQVPKEMYTAYTLTPLHGFANGVEGPGVDKSGILYAVNFEKQGTIGRVDPVTGEASIFVELPNKSIGNGIRFNKKGEMYVADYTNHNILKVDMKTKAVTVYANEPTMSQPNDIAMDSKNRFYASDPNWKASTGRIWRADANGKFTLLDSLGTANGIEVSPDEKRLYVNEAAQRKVWVYDLSADGNVSNKRLLIEFPDFGMDGMRCDVDGDLYIARFGKGTVARLSPDGKVKQEIKLIGQKPTNVAFGGKDGRTIYVTLQDNGNIEAFTVDKPGREWKMLR